MSRMTLLEQVARALAVTKGIKICSDATYAQSSFRAPAQAAVAAVFDWLADPSLAAQEAGKVRTVQGDDWCGVYSAMLAEMRREALGE